MQSPAMPTQPKIEEKDFAGLDGVECSEAVRPRTSSRYCWPYIGLERDK